MYVSVFSLSLWGRWCASRFCSANTKLASYLSVICLLEIFWGHLIDIIVITVILWKRDNKTQTRGPLHGLCD